MAPIARNKKPHHRHHFLLNLTAHLKVNLAQIEKGEWRAAIYAASLTKINETFFILLLPFQLPYYTLVHTPLNFQFFFFLDKKIPTKLVTKKIYMHRQLFFSRPLERVAWSPILLSHSSHFFSLKKIFYFFAEWAAKYNQNQYIILLQQDWFFTKLNLRHFFSSEVGIFFNSMTSLQPSSCLLPVYNFTVASFNRINVFQN